MTLCQWGLVALIVGYTSYFTRVTVDVHDGLGTSAYDFGLYDQGVWLLSRFQAPFVTLMGRNLFGDHSSFILLTVVPLYWVFPGAGTLLFVQSLVIALGAVPVFMLARRLLEREPVALVLAACYLLHPAVGWTNRENFHPDSFLGVFLGFAIWAALDRRWRMYALFVALALLVKEDASLVLVPIGVWVACTRSWRIGVASIVASITFMFVAMFGVMRSLIGIPTRNAWRVPFGGPTGFLRSLFSHPLDVVRHFWSDNRPFYFVQMTAPMAWVFLRAPSVALISLLVISTNMLSTFWFQYQIEYHYSLVAVPAIVMGTVWALSKVGERSRAILLAVVAISAATSSWAWGAMPFSRDLPYTWPPSHPVAEDGRDIIESIPADASVSAFHAMTAHLAHRTEIYMFPTPFVTTLYGADDSLSGTRLPAADDVDYVVLPATLEPMLLRDWLMVRGEFVLVDQNDWWRLFRRKIQP